MTPKAQKLNDADLENIHGGVSRTVDTGTSVDAVIRSGPGMSYGQIASLKNHTDVNTTGNNSYNPADGRTWYEINYPLYGWISGSLIGFF